MLLNHYIKGFAAGRSPLRALMAALHPLPLLQDAQVELRLQHGPRQPQVSAVRQDNEAEGGTMSHTGAFFAKSGGIQRT